jgi:hypothetical protein
MLRVEVLTTNGYRCCCLQTWDTEPVEMTREEVRALFDRALALQDQDRWGEILEITVMDGEEEFAALTRSWPSERAERYRTTYMSGHFEWAPFAVTVTE